MSGIFVTGPGNSGTPQQNYGWWDGTNRIKTWPDKRLNAGGRSFIRNLTLAPGWSQSNSIDLGSVAHTYNGIHADVHAGTAIEGMVHLYKDHLTAVTPLKTSGGLLQPIPIRAIIENPYLGTDTYSLIGPDYTDTTNGSGFILGCWIPVVPTLGVGGIGFSWGSVSATSGTMQMPPADLMAAQMSAAGQFVQQDWLTGTLSPIASPSSTVAPNQAAYPFLSHIRVKFRARIRVTNTTTVPYFMVKLTKITATSYGQTDTQRNTMTPTGPAFSSVTLPWCYQLVKLHPNVNMWTDLQFEERLPPLAAGEGYYFTLDFINGVSTSTSSSVPMRNYIVGSEVVDALAAGGSFQFQVAECLFEQHNDTENPSRWNQFWASYPPTELQTSIQNSRATLGVSRFRYVTRQDPILGAQQGVQRDSSQPYVLDVGLS